MRVERLDGTHDLQRFNSGNKALDDWLRNHAVENQRRDLSRTFVLVDDGGDVIGYYALTMGRVIREELPRPLGRGRPRYQIGMVLLARLAVGAGRQGEGLGRDLLVDAIAQATAAGRHAAARFLAVDPIDEAARRFYRHFGFLSIDGDERGRMYIRLDDVVASFAEATEDAD